MAKLRSALDRTNFEDDKITDQIGKILISKRGYDFRMPKKGESVVIQISGGLDSITMWNILLGKYKFHVYPVHFLNTNRIFQGEEGSIKHYSQLFRKLYPQNFHEVEIIKAPSYNIVNKLKINDVSQKMILNNLIYNEKIGKHQLLLNYSDNPLYERFFNVYVYAQKLRATVAKNLDTIFSNFVAEDTTISRNSTLTVLRSVNLSLCLILGDFSWQFTAALEKKAGFYLTKEILIKYAKDKGVSLHKTWTCMYNGNNQCGECGPCIIRREAFERAQIKDPTTYKSRFLKTGIKIFIKKIISNLIKKIYSKPIRKDKIIKPKSFKKKSLFPSSNVTWEEINGRINILHRNKGEIDILNESGSYIWQNIVKGRGTFNSLFNLLIKKYRTKSSVLKKDLTEFLNYCLSEDYLIVR